VKRFLTIIIVKELVYAYRHGFTQPKHTRGFLELLEGFGAIGMRPFRAITASILSAIFPA